MGSAHLRELAVVRDVAYDEVAGSVVAVDAHNWLYRYLTTTVQFTDPDVYTTADGTAVPNVLGVVRGLPKLLENDLLPAFVFDGAVVERKRPELDERRERKERAAEAAAAARAAGEEARARKLTARAQRLTPVVSETTRELLGLLDVPVVEAPAEGEAQAAHVARRGDADYVGTEDYDALLFGAPLTLRKLTSRGAPELMDLAATLERHGITREQLVDVAILCGTDYNDGVHGYGPVTAVEAVREHGDLVGVVEAEGLGRDDDGTDDGGGIDEGGGIDVEEAAAVRALFLDPAVTDDYAIDRTVAPDLARVREYVVEQWEIPADEVATAFERLKKATPLSV